MREHNEIDLIVSQHFWDSEAGFRKLLEEIGIGILIIQNNKIVFLNECIAQLYDTEIHEMYQWNYERAIQNSHPHDIRIVKSLIQKHSEKGNAQGIYRITTSKGIRWIDHHSITTQYNGNNAVMIILKDITHQKKTERKLRESRDKLNAIFNNTNNGVVIYTSYNNGENFVIKDFNHSSEKLEKIKKEDVIGKCVTDIFPDVKNFGLFDVFQRVWKTGEPEKFPVTYYDDGRVQGWRDNFVCKLPDNTIVAIYNDRTSEKEKELELKENTAHLDKVINTVSSGIALIEFDTMNIVDINDALARMIGKTKSEIIGDTCQNTFCVNYECPFIKERKEYDKRECKLQTKDGLIDVLKTVNKFQSKGKTYLLESIMDITDLKRLEEEQIKSQKMESIGILAGGIAHDFNNILMGIFGYVDLLYTTNIDEEQKEFLDDLKDATLRTRSLTKQLLNLSKGGLHPSKKTIRVERLLHECAKLSTKGTSCIYDIQTTSESLYINVDENQIAQVFNNLIINASHSMENSGLITINVSEEYIKKHNILEKGEYIRIDIKDEGCGIKEEDRKFIFNPYFTTKKEGHGLGLATSYSIINRHNGYITFKSEIDKGSIFTIYLPRSYRIMGKTYKKDRNISHISRLLVLEDNKTITELIIRYCEILGIEVVCTINGENTVEQYKKFYGTNQEFDAVILDIIVPMSIDGDEVLSRLKKINPNVKIVLSSGYFKNVSLEDVDKKSVKILRKPYTREEFEQMLSDLR